MSATGRLALGVLGTALLLGTVGDALLHVPRPGINVGLWVTALVTAGVVLARWQGVALSGGGRWFAVPAVGFALAFAWRDSPALGVMNALALGLTLGLVVWRGRAGRVLVATLGEYALGLALAGVMAAVGALALLFNHLPYRELLQRGWTRHLVSIVVGLGLALPLLLIFGGLLAAADATFEAIISLLWRWDLATVVAHAFVGGVIAWTAGGLLTQALTGPTGPTDARIAAWRPPALGLGIVEVGIVLGLLDALFLVFVVVQIPYLFGGAALVAASPTLTYAEYARRGFFELVTVNGLTLPVLLAAEWLPRKLEPKHRRIVRGLAALLVALLLVIVTSATHRLQLYTASYGLTEARLYAAAFMTWTALVVAWFAGTVLTGRGARFAAGIVAVSLAIVMALNVLNPDDLIVRTNAGRLEAVQPFDARYVRSLSADAAPALVEALPRLSVTERQIVAETLQRRWGTSPATDWRTWNWSRTLAWQVVQASLAPATDERTRR